MTACLGPLFQWMSNNGAGVGYKLHTYMAGTTTPLATFLDENRLTPHANPIILNANGAPGAQVFLYNQKYKFVLLDAADVPVDTWDHYEPEPDISDSYPYRLTTVAQIQAQSWTAANAPELVILSARAALGDGGGGKFAFDSTDTTTADDIGLVVVTSSGRRYKRVVDGDSFSAAWWGADFTALQAAVTATAARNFRLFVNPGNWVLGASDSLAITNDMVMFGAGPATIIQVSEDRTTPAIHITGASADNVKISDLRVESTFAGAPTVSSLNAAVAFVGVDDAALENVEIEGRFYVGAVFRDVNKYKGESLTVRGCRNRLVYVFEDCRDGSLYDLTLDGRNSAGDDYCNYCLNINPGGTDQPRRLTVDGVTCQGFISHGVSVAEDFEQITLANITGETTTAATVGLLLQEANSKRGREMQVSNVSFTGAAINAYFNGCDDFNATNIHSDGATGTTAGILIANCTNFNATNLSAASGAGAGVKVYGDEAGDCVDGVVSAVNCHDNDLGGLLFDAAATDAVQRMQAFGANCHDNTGYGVHADANCDSVDIYGGRPHTNSSGNVLNESTNGQTFVLGTQLGGDVSSDVYTPTVTLVTNIAANTVKVALRSRVGELVQVTGEVQLTATAGGGTFTEGAISLPLASTFAAQEDLAGVMTSNNGDVGTLFGDVANNRATFYVYPSDTSNRSWHYTFTYRLL